MASTIELSDPDSVVPPVQIICANNLDHFPDPERSSSSLEPEATTTGASTNPGLVADPLKWVWVLTDGYVAQADIQNLLSLIMNRQPTLLKEDPPRFLGFRDGVKMTRIFGSDYNTQVRVIYDRDLINPTGLWDPATQANSYRVSFTAREV